MKHDLAAAGPANPLVSTERMAGADVFDPDGNKLGTVHSLMIRKTDGMVAYAVLNFGGWMGFGGQHFPVPWSRLAWSTKFDGYVVSITGAELHEAPQFEGHRPAPWADAAWLARVDSHYGTE